MITRVAILAAAAVALSACTTTGTSDIDAAVQKNLPKVCSALETAHVAFSAVAATGKIKVSTVKKEAAAYAGVQTICSDPEHTSAINAAVLVGQAYVVVTAALKEAKQ
jgi:hypothetical protein